MLDRPALRVYCYGFMASSNGQLARVISRDLLPFVQQPGQYVGGEVGAVRKDWDSVALRFCLAFPDTYAIGMSHLGSGIIYHLLNAREDVLCERTYAPWVDAQDRMRQTGIPLFSWESRRPVREFDVVGFSLQYEMLYTNVLGMLDLAGIPVLAADRTGDDPLILAGGPGVNNPEPMAPFFDLMLIGEAEDALPQLVGRLAQRRAEGLGREDLIVALAREFDFLYAPGLLEPAWNADGTLAALKPKVDGLPERTIAAHVRDLESAPFPTAPLVPNTEVIHDRVTIEIMRGCPRRCRFCESGRTKGPVRLRSPERILDLARECYAHTGLEEISLTSLSPSDHPRLKAILTTLDAEFAPKGVSLSLPSLRTNDQLEVVPRLLGSVRKSGLTMVPEAALPRLRRVIGKPVDDEHLFAGAREAWNRGWNVVKLYFMIGLPGETEEDVRAIASLARRISDLRRESGKGPGRVNLAVSNFVPKPHTPFQFAAMAGADYLARTRETLFESLKERRLHLRIHRVDRSLLEGVLARGDRRIGRVVYEAWRAGARFDAWDETLNMASWEAAFKAAGIDPAFYAHRSRGRDEVFPWDRVLTGDSKADLWDEYQKALADASA
ncbi:MAG TPA: TIGR03960 family B12-binding radical SAM protein [Phycisphaerae bacterium]|nr:TIGR03960 family B12-binding radical SAM protein [Phycisphaerae bacterium]